MSEKTLGSCSEILMQTGIDTCWRQWRALGAGAAGDVDAAARSIIDPEALILFSLRIRDCEHRLTDMAAWLASTSSNLISVQRAKSLAETLGLGGLRLFARMAHEGGDRRWARLASNGADTSRRAVKGGTQLRLARAPALTLRLRAGFGVGARPDILSFLIGCPSVKATVREIAEAAGYTSAAVRSALQEMEMAGFVMSARSHPAVYWPPADKWMEMLYVDAVSEIPVWRDWAGLFGFLSDALDLVDGDIARNESSYVLSSAARDVYERHARTFEINRIAVPAPEDVRGADYLDAFARTIDIVRKWAKQNV